MVGGRGRYVMGEGGQCKLQKDGPTNHLHVNFLIRNSNYIQCTYTSITPIPLLGDHMIHSP